jgi:hypothetical protein
MLLVDGNSLENIDLVADADKNFVTIMKDGKIFKNNLNKGDDYDNGKTYCSWPGVAHLLDGLCHSSAGARL